MEKFDKSQAEDVEAHVNLSDIVIMSEKIRQVRDKWYWLSIISIYTFYAFYYCWLLTSDWFPDSIYMINIIKYLSNLSFNKAKLFQIGFRFEID